MGWIKRGLSWFGGRKQKPLTCGRGLAGPRGFPTLLSTQGDKEIIREHSTMGTEQQGGSVAGDTGNVSHILLFFICTSEVSPCKYEITNITYICKHQSHSTCLSHVTQSPGPWGHSGCLPVPSLLLQQNLILLK